MTMPCAACSAPLPERAAFCPACGTAVAAGGEGDGASGGGAASGGTAATPAPQGERRPVTALFADVVASTELTASLDAEDWAVIMNAAFEAMSEAIHRYEGTVARLMGDGVLAFFGAPSAHEDDPERAVRAALDMLRAVASLDERFRDALRRPLEIRVGISSGPVVVGDMGSTYRSEYTAVGDAVNLASRLQEAARPNAIVVGEETYARVAPLFEARPLEPIAAKGRSEPVRAFEVTGPRRSPQSRRGVPGLRSPMLGRDAELRRLLAALPPVRSGRGRVAFVLGEPGIGKTRLVEELRSAAQTEGRIAWTAGRCVSYGRNLPFHLLVDVVRGMVGIDEHATEEVAAAALRSRLDALLGDAAAGAYVYLAHLLGLDVRDARLEHRDAAVLQGHYVDSLARLLAAAAREAPVALVAEDVHWADESSVEALTRLLPALATMPVLVVCTSRSERDVPGWELLTAARRRFGDALVEIELTPLSPDASRDVVGHLLEIESLPPEVRDLILMRAEGNPFFVEEVIRMLIDRGLIVRQDGRWLAQGSIRGVEIPDTVRGLLLSRIDRLPAGAKSTLQVASVVGRSFAADLVDEVRTAAGEGSPEDLLELEAASLVQLVGDGSGLEYAFRHALVHETAYASLLRLERQRLHRLVGEALARRAPDPPGPAAAVLARHFEVAGDVRRSVGYLLEAAAFASGRSALREARAAYDRALELLGDVPHDDQASRWRAAAEHGRVVAGFTFVPNDESRADLEALLPRLEDLGDERRIAEAVLWLARIMADEGDVHSDAFVENLDRAKSLAARLDDPRLRAWLFAVQAEVAEGSDFRAATAHAAEAADLFEAQESRGLAAFYAAVAASAHARLGEFGRADELLSRAEALAADVEDPNVRLDIDLLTGVVEDERGRYDAATESLERGIALAEEVGNTRCLAFGSFLLGDLRLRLGDAAGAAAVLERSQEVATFCSMGGVATLSQVWLEAARVASGDEAGRLDVVDAGIERTRALGDRFGEALGLRRRALARAANRRPDWAAIRSDFEASIGLLEELDARPALARTAWEFGETLRNAGQLGANVHLERAEAAFVELGIAAPPVPGGVGEPRHARSA